MNYHIEFNLDFKRNPYPGTFIVLEGIDGSGKTTQVKRVKNSLTKLSGKEVFLTKEPTESVVGQLIGKIIRSEIKVPKTAIQYLFCADRVIHLEKVVIPKLKEGGIVLCDRYFWSSLTYGIADRDGVLKADGDTLFAAQSILSMYHQFIVPDFTFYLRVAVSTAISRLSKMQKIREIYEEKGKLLKIAKGYDWVVEQFPKEITVIDGEKSPEEVTKQILQAYDTRT